MNDQQLIDALRSLGNRPATPAPGFSEQVWSQLERRRSMRHLTLRREALLLASVLLLGFAFVLAGVGFRDREQLVSATAEPTHSAMPSAGPSPEPEPSLDMAAVLGSWQPTPIPVPNAFAAELEAACRERWFESEELFGRPHRGDDYVLALLDARGEGRATLGFRASDGRVNFCNVELTDQGQVDSVYLATSGEAPLSSPDLLWPTQIEWGMSWSDRGGTKGSRTWASGPYGRTGEQIAAAVMESVGHPPVSLSVANGLCTYWVPWVWDEAPSTVTGFDAAGNVVIIVPSR